MKIPTHLKHQPIIKLENYSKIDGNYDKETTDAQGLSLGLAQWGNNDLSAKVWRHSGKKWSRQSEEVPLHRVIDLASLICSAIYFAKKNELPKSSFELSMSDNSRLQDALKEALNENYIKNNLDEPLKRLSDVLRKLGY